MHTPRKGPLSNHVFLTITFAVANHCLSAGEGQCEVRPDSRFSPSVAKPSLIQTRSTVGQQVLRESSLALQGEVERGASKPSKFSAAVIVVTGATGYIGSHTILSLLATGYHVVGVDDVSSSGFYVAMQLHSQAEHFNPLNDATFVFYEADIAKNDHFEKILEKEKPAAVMHFAGVAYDGEENPRRYQNNTVYAHKVAEAMTKAGVKILVHSSSCAVYGSPAHLPVTEETPEAPVNAYGRSRLAAEAVLKDWERKQNSGKPSEPARLVIMRYFNVIGADPLFRLGELRQVIPDMPRSNYVGRLTTVLFDAAEGLLPKFIFKSSNYPTQDGTAVRDYVDVMDVVDAHLAVLPSLLTDREVQTVRIYNVASGQPRSVEEVVNMTEAVTGKHIQILTGFGQPSDPPALWADPSKLHREVGWSPRYLDLWGSLHRAWTFRNRSSTKEKLVAHEKAKQALHLTSLEITDESGFSVTSSLVEQDTALGSEQTTLDASVLSVATDTDTGSVVVEKAKKSSAVSSSGSNLHAETDPEENPQPAGEPSWNHSLMMTEMDLVIPTVRSLGFLEDWREFVQGMHVIIVQGGDPDIHLTIPDWVDYELYNRRDINWTLGKDAWIISPQDASIRMFGFLASKKRYILTWDDDVYPCRLYGNKRIDAPWDHYNNLKTNSTPVYLNNYFDPFSMRIGVPTAISHGLWLNSGDYDMPTQIMRPPETLTVPRGAIYSMLGRNMAFNRELIGPALMFGLMGDGDPWGRRADMWAGWASKVCVDRLGLSVKTGSPYVNHSKAKQPKDLGDQYQTLTLQEKVSYFFQKLRLSDTATRGPAECYAELASRVRQEIGEQHAYFRRLADAMEVWIKVWTAATAGHVKFQPSRSSSGRAAPVPAPPQLRTDFLEAGTTLKPPGIWCHSHIKLIINSHVTYGKVLAKVFESLRNASFTSWEDVVVIRGGMGRNAAPRVDKYGITWVDVSLDSYDFNAFYGLHLHLHHRHVCARYAYLYVPDTVGFHQTFPARFSELIAMTRREIRMTRRPNSNIFAFGAGIVYAYGNNFDHNLTKHEVQMAESGSPPPPMKSLEVFSERVVIEGERTADPELVDLYETGHPRRKYFYPRFGVYKYAQE